MAQFNVEIHFYSFGFSGQHVATIQVEADNVEDALEHAYRLSQNLESSWVHNPGVRLTEWGADHARSNATDGREPGMRSSSVGDEFVCASETYVCASETYVCDQTGFKVKSPQVLADLHIATHREIRHDAQAALNRHQNEEEFVQQFVPQLEQTVRHIYRDLKAKIDDAEARSGRHLGDANAAAEAGHTKTAEHHHARSQYWLDRANRLRGW